jgi:hypothetical protein
MTVYDEEQLGELVGALPPAPQAWVEAAKEAPLSHRRLEAVLERAEADDEYRRRLVTDPERALEEADVVAHAENIEIIRKRLDNK